MDISDYYRVPVAVIEAVARQEGGKPGLAVGPNRDGTYDLGRMQINTWWFAGDNPARLQLHGITLKEVRDNDCTNIAVGTWILRDNFNRYGNWYDAIAAYNAGKPDKGRRYADQVFARLNVSLTNKENVHGNK